MPITVSVEGQVFGKYDHLTDRLRTALRQNIPELTKEIKRRVAEKLAPGVLFKTTTRLLPALSSEMVENSKEIYGRVYIDEAKFPGVVAATLERGSKPHEIEAKNAAALSFFWERLGIHMVIRKVNHPGFEGRSYMQSTLDESKGYIDDVISRAVLLALTRSEAAGGTIRRT